MKRKKVKKKIKFKNFLLLLLIILVIGFSIYLLLNSRIRTITIKGTNNLSDDEVLEISKLKDYPSFFFTLNYDIKRRIKKLDLVKDVKIKRGFFNTITLEIKENKVLLSKDNKYILENGKQITINKIIDVPILTNSVSGKTYNKLIDAMCEVNTNILEEISEIEYVPNTYDKGRFLLYMDDGNSVYLTLTKFDLINKYNSVLPQLEGRKGFLYLDSGNHFKIME